MFFSGKANWNTWRETCEVRLEKSSKFNKKINLVGRFQWDFIIVRFVANSLAVSDMTFGQSEEKMEDM